VALAEASLLAGLDAGTTYLSIHTSVFPGGEIRGFLQLEAPDPSSFLLAGSALGGLLLRRRR
jgi:MYXO-CTERM domain-containing protein